MKQYMMSFGIGAAIGSSFGKAFRTINDGLGETSKRLNSLNSEGKRTSYSIEKLEKSIEKSNTTLENNKKELIELSAKKADYRKRIEATIRAKNKEGADTKALTKKEKDLRDELGRLNEKYNKKMNTSKEIANRNSEEKKSVENLRKSYDELGKEIETTEKKKLRYEKAQKASERATAVGGVAKTSFKAAGTATALGAGLLRQAVKSESAFADVKKQFDFKNEEDEKVFKQELHKLVTEKELAIPIEELYQAAASMGQSGIQGMEAIDYVEMAARMGIAFDMTKDESAKAMIGLKNSFQLPQDELNKLLNQINALANNSGANASQITDFMGRVGNIGKIAGFTEAQIAGVGAALIEQGMSAEIAATGTKKVFGVLSKGFSATANEKEALAMIGLDPEALAKEAQTNAEGAMLKVLTNISKLDKDKQGAIMKMLFGEEGLRAGAGLISGLDKMQTHMKNAQNKSFYEGSVDKEVKARNSTTENELVVLRGQLELLGAQMGTALIPYLKEGMGYLSGVVGKLTKLMNENPEKFKKIVSLFVKGTIALYGLSAGLGVVSAGFKAYSLFMNIKAVTTGLSFTTMLTGAGTKLKAFGIALKGLAMNPYVMGITAAIAAGVLLYKNWDWVKAQGITIKESVVEMVQAIGVAFGEFKTSTVSIFSQTFEWMQGKWDALKQKGMDVASYFVGIFEKIKTGMDNINPVNLGKKGISWIKDKASSAGNWLGENLNIPAYAIGGVVSSPTLAMVGEGGVAESIIPHNNSQRSYDLWKNAGERIGAFKEKSSSVISFTFAPVIHANDSKGVKEVLERERAISQREFERMYKTMEEDRRRRGNGR